MRRLLLLLTAALALAGPMAGDAAWAQDGGRGHGHGRWDRGDDRGRGGGYEARGRERPGRGPGPERGPDRGPDRGYAPPYGPRGYDRGPVARDYAPAVARPYRNYAPTPPGPRVRRGGYMPPAYRGESLGDYGRYRLRPPPRGYAWYRVGGGYALVSIYTGQIFDMIPD